MIKEIYMLCNYPHSFKRELGEGVKTGLSGWYAETEKSRYCICIADEGKDVRDVYFVDTEFIFSNSSILHYFLTCQKPNNFKFHARYHSDLSNEELVREVVSYVEDNQETYEPTDEDLEEMYKDYLKYSHGMRE